MDSSVMTKEMWAAVDNFPLAQPPPGVVANLDHPVWHGHGIIITASVGVPTMLVMAAVRIYSKCYLTRKWVMDDYIFLVSLASALALIAQHVALVRGGAYGYHAWDVKIGELTKPVLLRSLVLQVITGLLTWLIKLALFSLIFHTFRPLAYVRRLVYIGLFLSGAYYIVAAVVNGIYCGPRGGTDRVSYLAGLGSHSCGNPSGIIQIFSVLSGVVNLTVDLYLLIIPLRAISKLNLPKRRKAGVFLIFLTGGGACVMSILVLYYRTLVFNHDAASSWNNDITHRIVSILTVSTLEFCVGVIIPCMAPSAKILKLASDQVNIYMSSKFTGFRRTKSHDSMKDERELKTIGQGAFQERRFPVEASFSQNDTIDRMLTQIPREAVVNERIRNGHP